MSVYVELPGQTISARRSRGNDSSEIVSFLGWRARASACPSATACPSPRPPSGRSRSRAPSPAGRRSGGRAASPSPSRRRSPGRRRRPTRGGRGTRRRRRRTQTTTTVAAQPRIAQRERAAAPPRRLGLAVDRDGADGPGGNCILPLPGSEWPRPTPLLSVVRIRKRAPSARAARIAEAPAESPPAYSVLTSAIEHVAERSVEERELGRRAGADPQRRRRAERRARLHRDAATQQRRRELVGVVPTSTSTKFVALPASGSRPCARRSTDERRRRRLGSRPAAARPRPRRRGSPARPPARAPRRRSRAAPSASPRRPPRARRRSRPGAPPGRRASRTSAARARRRPAHEVGDRVEPAGGIEIVEVRLVDHRQDCSGKVADERDQLVARDGEPGRVVRGRDEERAACVP